MDLFSHYDTKGDQVLDFEEIEPLLQLLTDRPDKSRKKRCCKQKDIIQGEDEDTMNTE